MTTSKILGLTVAAALIQSCKICNAFLSPVSISRHQPSSLSNRQPTSPTQLHDVKIMDDSGGSPDAPKNSQEDAALQWDLFTRHHAQDGEWWGTWTTYNYMGDMVDSTVGGVSLQPDAELTSVSHTHRILTSSTSSDCDTCFDSSNVKTIPITTHTPDTLGKRHRCAAVGMVAGPSLLRSGIMSTELTLRHGDGRVRVTFQHAPVWERGIEPGSCPPQGLKLFRAVVSKEKLRPSSNEKDSSTEGKVQGPPTADEEKSSPPAPGNPRFFRPVPPFAWHAKWAGTSWTWGPSTGDRGWAIEEVDDADAWHGRNGETSQSWSLRLPGGVFIQCPRVIIGGDAALCRLAWTPEDAGEEGTMDDGNTAKLLRVEASVVALEPIISDDDEDMMVGFYPPSLGSLRCDVLEKVGELEGSSLEERERAAEGFVWTPDDEEAGKATSAKKGETVAPIPEGTKSEKTSAPIDEETKKKIAADPRSALDF